MLRMAGIVTDRRRQRDRCPRFDSMLRDANATLATLAAVLATPAGDVKRR
jgi:hypothetical protein